MKLTSNLVIGKNVFCWDFSEAQTMEIMSFTSHSLLQKTRCFLTFAPGNQVGNMTRLVISQLVNQDFLSVFFLFRLNKQVRNSNKHIVKGIPYTKLQPGILFYKIVTTQHHLTLFVKFSYNKNPFSANTFSGDFGSVRLI